MTKPYPTLAQIAARFTRHDVEKSGGAYMILEKQRRTTMHDHQGQTAASPKRTPWNKDKLIGPKPPLRPKYVWSIRTKLQIEGRTRDLAMFNLAIDSKLRGCDVAALRVEVMALGACAIDRAGSIESTVRYLGSEVDDALAIAEQVDV